MIWVAGEGCVPMTIAFKGIWFFEVGIRWVNDLGGGSVPMTSALSVIKIYGGVGGGGGLIFRLMNKYNKILYTVSVLYNMNCELAEFNRSIFPVGILI